MAKNVVGSVLDIIKYYVLRGAEWLKIVTRVRELYPGTRTSIIAAGVDIWKRAMQAAKNLRQSGPNRSTTTLNFPLINTRKAKSLSVDVNFSFNNPETEELQKAGFNIKVPLGMTKQQLQNYINGKIFEWIVQHYELRRGDWTNFTKLVPEVRLIAIAGE